MRDFLVKSFDRPDLDLSIARARIALSLATLLSIYIDPAIGGFFTIAPPVLAALFCHLAYGLVVHEAVRRRVGSAYLPALSAIADVLFAAILAIFTEGHTSPAFAFFAFAIIAVGCRAGLRTTLVITSLSMLLYFLLDPVPGTGDARPLSHAARVPGGDRLPDRLPRTTAGTIRRAARRAPEHRSGPA